MPWPEGFRCPGCGDGSSYRLASRALRRCSCSASSGSPATSPPGFANLKTWLLGTHHGVGAKHLPHYVDEFVFRFNRRRTPMAAFQSLLGPTIRHAPTTYQMLYAAEPTG